MDLGLAQRVFIVTGGSRGLGRATAEVLVEEGARVVLCARDEAQVSSVAAELGGHDVALGLPGDLAEPGTEGRIVAAAMARFGRVDGALLSVGGPPGGSALEVPDAAWRAAFEQVFLGPLRCARAVAAAIEGPGSIAFVLSTSVRAPIPGLATSNGLRPGLAMLAKNLADELAPRGVRVNGLLPGRIDTDRVRELDATGRTAARTRKAHESTIPLGRYGEPAEFGRAATFLLSPAASYVTGAMVPVDGGALRAL